jgi:hypothetical protein
MGINPMSLQRLLATNMAFYYNFDECTDTGGPLNPFNTIIDVETGQGAPFGC